MKFWEALEPTADVSTMTMPLWHSTHSSLDNNDYCQDTGTGKNTTCSELVETSLKKDLLWSLAGDLPVVDGEDLPLLGSVKPLLKKKTSSL